MIAARSRRYYLVHAHGKDNNRIDGRAPSYIFVSSLGDVASPREVAAQRAYMSLRIVSFVYRHLAENERLPGGGRDVVTKDIGQTGYGWAARRDIL